MGAGISQSKWLWFRQEEPRSLQDLQLFDDASRGPWGATQLLISLKARHLAFLGACLVILTNFFDPFLQQVVSYPDRLVPSSSIPTIARTQIYESKNQQGLPLPDMVDLPMKAAIYNGIFDIEGRAELAISHSCQTGNCSWASFSSLAVCSKCEDISSYIHKACDHDGDDCQRYTLPDGPQISGSERQINTSVSNISSSLAGIEASLLKFSILTFNKTQDSSGPTATECAMWYCIKNYTASVTDGVISEHVLSTWRNDSASLSSSSDLYFTPPDSSTNSTHDPTTFRVTLLAAKALHSFMSQTLTGSGLINSSNSSGSSFTSDVMQALLLNAPNITSRVDNLATSMSNNIQEQENAFSNHANGTAWRSETYVQVRWGWFAFPATVVVSASLFLLGTILETAKRDVMIWKANNLALLFHGRELKLTDDEQTPANRLSEITKRAGEVEVELVKVFQDWKFVQR